MFYQLPFVSYLTKNIVKVCTLVEATAVCLFQNKYRINLASETPVQRSGRTTLILGIYLRLYI